MKPISYPFIRILNGVFVLSLILALINDPIRYPIEGKTFLAQFQDPLLFFLMIDICLCVYFVSRTYRSSQRSLIVLGMFFHLPLLYLALLFAPEFVMEAVQCITAFCGDVFPPTFLDVVSSPFLIVVPFVNLIYLFCLLRRDFCK